MPVRLQQSCNSREAYAEGDADKELVRRILQGDPRAGEEFVDRYSRLIYTVLHRMGLSSEEKEDMCQQVFLHLWDQDCRRLRCWQGKGKGRLSSYLGILVARLACEHIRVHQARHSACTRSPAPTDEFLNLLPAPDPDLVTYVCDLQKKSAIDHALEQLAPRDAELIRGRHYRGQSYREISQALGITVNHVGVALARAERRLRVRLDACSPGLFDRV